MASIVEKYEELLAAMWTARAAYLAREELSPLHGSRAGHLPEARALREWVDALPEPARDLLDRVTCLGALGKVRLGNIHGICKGAEPEKFAEGLARALELEWDLFDILQQAA